MSSASNKLFNVAVIALIFLLVILTYFALDSRSRIATLEEISANNSEYIALQEENITQLSSNIEELVNFNQKILINYADLSKSIDLIDSNLEEIGKKVEDALP